VNDLQDSPGGHATKDSETLRYFEAEMRYLREAGKEFAQAFPDRARMLNMDRVGDGDPHVQHLCEGFAFLMGRLRHKLDDELPELTEGLMNMLWPHYLRMIPSVSILEMVPSMGDHIIGAVIPAGREVISDPVGRDAVKCTYRTTQPVALHPVQLTKADARTREDGRSVLRFRFTLQTVKRGVHLDLSCLRLYLHADRSVAFALYAAMTNAPLAVNLCVPGYPKERPGAPQVHEGLHLAPAGFAAAQRLWPKADNAFGGYQLLLEYFTFPEKFMFVDVLGLRSSAIPADAAYVDIEVVLATGLPVDIPFSEKNVRLFCTPIINLFTQEAEPVSVTHLETEYQVRANGPGGTDVDVYAVENVSGRSGPAGDRFDYAPFAAFRHRGGMLRHELPERYFHTRMRRGPSGRCDTYLVLGGHAWERERTLLEERLSVTVTCTNGLLPRQGLGEARIRHMGHGFMHVDAVRNLTAPTMPVYPPTGERYQWRVLSHLAPNYVSLLDAERLRGSLALYDWTEGALNKRRIEAITHVTHRLLQKMVKGGLQRGVEIEVTVSSERFSGDGDLQLFSALLNRFFGLYATLNLFTKLVVVTHPEGRRIVWPLTKGEGAPW